MSSARLPFLAGRRYTPAAPMNLRLQDAIMRMYRTVLHTGLFETRLGYYALERCYDVYKAILEAPSLRHIRPFVPAGSTVIDVGAHCGYHTKRFGTWVGPRGRVIAIEPEPVNFARLKRRVARLHFQGRVTTLNVALADRCGEFFLRINPEDPADHQLAPSGHPVLGKSLDVLMSENDIQSPALIKLDIQGSEVLALQGAHDTIKRFRPALLVEVDDERLRHQGFSASEMLRVLTSEGYVPRPLGRHGISEVVEPDAALAMVAGPGRYADFLFVDRDHPDPKSAIGGGRAPAELAPLPPRSSESSS
jgi:FkbM family methyltransferase